MKKYVTDRDIAERLGISRREVTWKEWGLVPVRSHGRNAVFDLDDVERVLKSREFERRFERRSGHSTQAVSGGLPTLGKR